MGMEEGQGEGIMGQGEACDKSEGWMNQAQEGDRVGGTGIPDLLIWINVDTCRQ